MKLLSVILVVALASSPLPSAQPALLKISFNDVMEIIGGVFVGMAVDVKAEDVAPCVSDTASIGLKLEEAFHYYELKTYEGKVKAMALLGEAYKQLPDFMKECKAGSEEEADAIARMVLAWAHPVSVLAHMGENLVVNGADILAEVSFAMNAWEFKQYYDFGFYCGEAGFKVLYVPPAKPTVDVEAVRGIAQGIGKVFGFAVEIDFSQELASKFGEMFTHERDFGGVVGMLKNFGEGVEGVCTEMEQQGMAGLLEVSKAVEVLKEPSSLVMFKKIIVLNGVHLEHLWPIVADYKSSDWVNVGFYAGQMLKTIQQALR